MKICLSNQFRVTAIKKPTKAKLFSEVEVGDLLRFSITLSHAGHASGGGVYATSVLVENITQLGEVYKSQSELTNILERSFELEEEYA